MSPNVAQGVLEISIITMWENTSDVVLDLYFADGKVKFIGIINETSGVSSISAIFKLECKGLSGWSLENSWSKDDKK